MCCGYKLHLLPKFALGFVRKHTINASEPAAPVEGDTEPYSG